MKRTFLVLFALVISVLLSACETNPPLVVERKPLVVDAELLRTCKTFSPREKAISSEYELYLEYVDIASAYTPCYHNHNNLVKLLLEKRVVEKPTTFSPESPPSNTAPVSSNKEESR